MRFEFSPADEAFRAELSSFYDGVFPDGWGEDPDWRDRPEAKELVRRVRRELGERRWLCMAWPERYGGMDAPISRQMVFSEETARRRFYARDQGATFLGPAILEKGTEEQKDRFLLPIARAEVTFHQGFSEPNAGSDLTGLQTRAERDGDWYVINGQKIWGGEIDTADYSFLLARSDPNAPKHQGISFFVIPAKTPGIRFDKFENLGGHVQNIVYYDDVRVPARESLIGEENQGWYVATAALNLERTMIEHAANGKLMLEDIVALMRHGRLGALSASALALTRHKLARIAIESEVARMLSFRIGWLQSQGEDISYAASQIKVFGSEMAQRHAHLGAEVLGLHAQVPAAAAARHLSAGGRVEQALRLTIGHTLAGGTSEIQRNIIATRGLGLPRA